MAEPTPRRIRSRSRWLIAAGVLLVLAGLGLAEGTGVTHVTEFVSGVFRPRAPEGASQDQSAPVGEPAPAVRAPVKLAIVDVGTQEKVPAAFVDLLLVAFSKQPEIMLLERAQIDRLLREQALSLSMSKPVNSAEVVQAGRLWAVDTFVMLEASKDDKQNLLLRLRLVDAHHGVKIMDSDLLLDPKAVQEQAELLAQAAGKKLTGFQARAKELQVVGVSTFRSEEVSKSWDWLSESLARGVELHLALAPGLILAERTKTRTLTDERHLAEGLPETLKASATLVDGAFHLDRQKSLDAVSVVVQARRGGKVLFQQRVEGSLQNPGALAQEIATAVVAGLGEGGGAESMPPELEAKLLAQQARAYMSGNFYANQPERALPAAEAALALAPDSNEYRFLVLKIMDRQIDEWWIDQVRDRKTKGKHWLDAVAYCQRAIPLAEQLLAGPKDSLPPLWPETVRRVFYFYEIFFSDQIRNHLLLDPDTEESLKGVHKGLRDLHAQASAHPSCKVVLMETASRRGYLWCETPEQALELMTASLEESVEYFKKNPYSTTGSVILPNSNEFMAFLQCPMWSPRKDVEQLYAGHVQALRSHREPLLRAAGELRAVMFYSSAPGALHYDQARKHYEAFIALLKTDLAADFPRISLACSSWVYLSLSNTRFSDDPRQSAEIKADYARNVLDFVLEDQRRFDRLSHWKSCVRDVPLWLEGAGKGEEAIAFLEKHANRLKSVQLAAGDDPEVLTRPLAELQKKYPALSSRPEVDPALRAVLGFRTSDEAASFKRKDWAPGSVQLRRLVLDDGVLAVVCTQAGNKKERYGLLRLDGESLRPTAFDALPVELALDSKWPLDPYYQYGPEVAADGEDIYVGSPLSGLVCFPKQGPPKLWSEKDGLATSVIGPLAFLDGKLYAVMGSRYTDEGLMAVDLRTGVSEVLFSTKVTAAKDKLDGRRISSVVADKKRHCLWISVGADYNNRDKGAFYAYYPGEQRLVKHFDAAQGVESLRKSQNQIIITSYHFALAFDLENEKISGLVEAKGQELTTFAFARRGRSDFWCSRLLLPVGPQVIYCDRDPYKTTLLSFRAGDDKPVSILESCFPPDTMNRVVIKDLALTPKGLLVLTNDALYVVPGIVDKK